MPTRNRVDFKELLRFHLRHLHKLSRLFDQGDQEAASYLAVPMRTMFYKSRTCCPLLLEHLDARKIQIANTCGIGELPRQPVKGGPSLKLVKSGLLFEQSRYSSLQFAPSEGWSFRPSYAASWEHQKQFVDAEVWWEQTVLAVPDGDTQRHAFTRKSIVVDVMHKIVGHADSEISEKFERFITGYMYTNVDGRTVHFPEHNVALRQFAFELLNSPELLKLASEETT